MARVGANLLYIVIYGAVPGYTPEAAYSTPDPAYRETGGYTDDLHLAIINLFVVNGRSRAS